MIPQAFSLGPFTIHIYGLIIAVAILIGWFIVKKRSALYKISPNLFDDPILLLPFILGIIGARFYHVIDKWDFYRENLDQILFIANGGLGIWGGLLGLFIGFYFVAKIKKIKLLTLLDLLAPSVILGQAIGRIGNFINQEGFGPPTNLPWGVTIDPVYRPLQYQSYTHFHPTFFYEAILDAIFFIILIYLSKKLKVNGQIFALYLVFYSLGRFIVEFYRIDTWIIGPLKIAHVLSIITLTSGVLFFCLTKIRHTEFGNSH